MNDMAAAQHAGRGALNEVETIAYAGGAAGVNCAQLWAAS
jgi:hypothetical protein